jgi:hypothetical protein
MVDDYTLKMNYGTPAPPDPRTTGHVGQGLY